MAFPAPSPGTSRLAFGTGKVGYLVGFANGLVLAITGLMIGVESLQRVFQPEEIAYVGAWSWRPSPCWSICSACASCSQGRPPGPIPTATSTCLRPICI